jgi:hypothetical protein
MFSDQLLCEHHSSDLGIVCVRFVTLDYVSVRLMLGRKAFDTRGMNSATTYEGNAWKSAATRQMTCEAMQGSRRDEWQHRCMDEPRGFVAWLRRNVPALDRRAR